jgi:NAD dependent epimerase/dehydratase family enzyme
MQVLIAGGTGFIGRALRVYLEGMNIDTKVLTRKASESYHVAWTPELKTCDISQLRDVTHIINLTGEGIVYRNWSRAGKKPTKPLISFPYFRFFVWVWYYHRMEGPTKK